jgi:hypothetical protein
MDYAATFPNTNIIYAGGTAENILTDKRDIGRFVARIIKDERTLNQKVVTVGDSLTQNQIWDIVERAGDEKVPKTHVSYPFLTHRLWQRRSLSIGFRRRGGFAARGRESRSRGVGEDGVQRRSCSCNAKL